MVSSALLCSADPNFKRNRLQMLQTESLLKWGGGFFREEAGQNKIVDVIRWSHAGKMGRELQCSLVWLQMQATWEEVG